MDKLDPEKLRIMNEGLPNATVVTHADGTQEIIPTQPEPAARPQMMVALSPETIEQLADAIAGKLGRRVRL